MKFSQIGFTVIVAAILSIFVPRASAQLGVDTFHPMRNVAIGAPWYLSGSATVVTTNGPADLVNFSGFSTISFFCNTNAGSVQCVVQIYTSADKTNWMNLPTYALATPTSFVITNTYFLGTNLLDTNIVYLPGAIVLPNAATAMFSAPYLAYAPNTNTASTITLNGAGLTVVGFQKTDQSRYIEYSIVSAAEVGSSTNASGFAWYTGYPNNPQGD